MLYTAPVSYDGEGDMARVFERNRDDWDVRAFHWGSLTSRSALTAFWILLAPFAMANVAGWMSESPNVWSRIWIRVAGLSLTGIFFAQTANMGLDIPLASGTSQFATYWIYLGVCVLVIMGLGLLSTQSSFREISLIERLPILFGPSMESMRGDIPAQSLDPETTLPIWDDPSHLFDVVGTRMWIRHPIVHRLRRLHLSFGMAVFALVAARVVDDATAQIGAVVVAGLAMVALALTTGRTAELRSVVRITAILPLLGLAVLVWGLLAFATGDVIVANASDDLTFQIALLLGIAAGAGLVGELVMSRFRKGWVPLGLLAVATLLGALLGLTGAMLAESYLTDADSTAATFDQGAAFVTVGALGMVLTILVAFLVVVRARERDRVQPPLRRGILRARTLLTVAGVYGVLYGAVAVLLSCVGPEPGCTQANIVMPEWVLEDQASQLVFLGIPFDPASLLGWAKLLMVAVPALLIVRSIVGGLLNGQDARRQVGILWDLGSFWPRWFHPLAPPAYGPYAVNRLQSIIDRESPDVVAAHSQGSLIAAVAMSLTDFDRVPRLFITYGSQLGELYPSLFPSVGFDRLIPSTDNQLAGNWINLCRDSDAIGGQMIYSLSNRNWIVQTGSGHSRYELTPEFCAARKACFSGELGQPMLDDIADCWDQPS